MKGLLRLLSTVHRLLPPPKSLSSQSNPTHFRHDLRSFPSYSLHRLRTLARPLLITSKKMEQHSGLSNGGGSHAPGFSTVANGGGDGVARFPLSSSSELVIQKGDITKWFVDGSSDAIVNPANERMLGGSGADGAIHDAAGPELRAACYSVPEVRPGVRCATGEARITPGFRLPVAYVIHTVGPIYNQNANSEAALRSAYRSSLRLAKENNIQYIAFPAISCGIYRYPIDEAAAIAVSTVKEFANDFKEVHFVLFSDVINHAWLNKANELLRGL